MSDRVPSISPETLNHFLNIFFTKLGIAVNYHESMCHVEKLILYLQCQGHSEGLYNKNMTIFTVSSKLLVSLEPNLV